MNKLLNRLLYLPIIFSVVLHENSHSRPCQGAFELSDKEKREFIESLAKPIGEEQVFYHWVNNQRDYETLIKAGEMTPKLYELTMRRYKSYTSDRSEAGLYVSKDPVSSEAFGEIIIQVRIDPNYKYLDTNNPHILKSLREKGINIYDVYALNPRIMLRDGTGGTWYVLKGQEGIKFEPFSIKDVSLKDISLEELGEIYRRKKERNTNRLFQQIFNNSSIRETEREYGRGYLRKKIRTYISRITSIKEVNSALEFSDRYLTEKEIRDLIEKAKSLPIRSVREGEELIQFADKYLPPKDIHKQLEKLPIKNFSDGVHFFSISKSPVIKTSIASKIKSLPVQSEQSVRNFLIAERGWLYLSAENISQLMKKLHINNALEILDFLMQGEELPNTLTSQIIQKIPIQNLGDGLSLLTKIELSSNLNRDKGKLIERLKAFPIRSSKSARMLIERGSLYLSIVDINKIVEKTPIQNAEDGVYFLTKIKQDILSSEVREKLIDRMLEHIDSDRKLKKLLTNKEDYKYALESFQSIKE